MNLKPLLGFINNVGKEVQVIVSFQTAFRILNFNKDLTSELPNISDENCAILCQIVMELCYISDGFHKMHEKFTLHLHKQASLNY